MSKVDIPEVRCSTKRDAGFYAKLGKDILRGSAATETVAARPAASEVVITGLGNAVSTSASAVSRLTSAGVAKVLKIETSLVTPEPAEGETTSRGIACIRVTLKGV